MLYLLSGDFKATQQSRMVVGNDVGKQLHFCGFYQVTLYTNINSQNCTR